MLYKVSKNFSDEELNFIREEQYNNWIIYILEDSKDFQIKNGKGTKSIYTLTVSKNYPHWKMSLMDFIGFQESLNKNIIISTSEEDLEAAEAFYKGHNFNDSFLRDYEPKVMIHSTTSNCWENIQADGCLKAWNRLKKEKNSWEEHPIGEKLGDPSDFSDYIMFSNGSIASEIVVLSKQIGKITMNEDMIYTPGVRLYFDMKKIAEDGLLIRDGCHFKVKESLPLKPYLIWAANWENIGLLSKTSTPKEFTYRANKCFNEIYGEEIFT